MPAPAGNTTNGDNSPAHHGGEKMENTKLEGPSAKGQGRPSHYELHTFPHGTASQSSPTLQAMEPHQVSCGVGRSSSETTARDGRVEDGMYENVATEVDEGGDRGKGEEGEATERGRGEEGKAVEVEEAVKGRSGEVEDEKMIEGGGGGGGEKVRGKQ